MVDRLGKDTVERYGGAGGMKDFKVKVLPLLEFKNLNDIIRMENISVSTEAIHTGDDVYYGNIGQDLIKQYPSMTIDFNQSWIRFNN